MTSYLNPVPQNSAHMKEYGLNKPTPFSGDRMRVKAFLQECLVHIDMNKEIYVTDKLKIWFVLSYMNEKEVKDWQELHIESIKDPATGKLVYPTFSAFLTEVCKAFWSADQVQDAICKLENLKQGKKMAEQVITEFKQLIGQAGLTTRSMSDNIHPIGLFIKALNYSLAHKIMFGEVIPRTIDDWFEKAIHLIQTNGHFWPKPKENKDNKQKLVQTSWEERSQHDGCQCIDIQRNTDVDEAEEMLQMQEDGT